MKAAESEIQGQVTTPGTTGPIGCGQKRLRDEGDGYWGGRRSIYTDAGEEDQCSPSIRRYPVIGS